MEKAINKRFYTQMNIGKVKYVINYYDGQKHNDGSDFFGIKTFRNKIKFQKEIKKLKELGYAEMN